MVTLALEPSGRPDGLTSFCRETRFREQISGVLHSNLWVGRRDEKKSGREQDGGASGITSEIAAPSCSSAVEKRSPTRPQGLRVSAHRDQSDRSIAITRIGPS